ncbi:GNAT family N-acetyltransferase [Blautia luti]|uniref:GNAT family N-acetyltransferase n=1 Tax=Blautia luti TaxID=89014 RepID=UPI002ED49252
MLQYGIETYNIQELTVNEQNPQAVGFYEHMGFQTYKRTDHDEEGNPYPLLYMRLSR